MASIREVAKIAGVSPSTVSRVMNGTAKVEEDKRQRVLAAIEETGFKPNELARAIEEEAYQHGYKILLCNSNENVEINWRLLVIIGFEATDDALAAVEARTMAVTVAQQPDLMGATAVETAIKLINGETVEKVLPVEVTLVK